MKLEYTYFKKFALGFGLSMLFNFCVFVYSFAAYFRPGRWIGNIPQLAIQNLLIGFLFPISISLLFAFFFANFFSFLKNNKNVRLLRKKIGMAVVLFFAMLAFNNFIYPRLEIFVFVNTYKIASSNSNTGIVSSLFFNKEKENFLMNDPTSFTFPRLNKFIDSLQMEKVTIIKSADSLLNLLPAKTAEHQYKNLHLGNYGLKKPVGSRSEISNYEEMVINSNLEFTIKEEDYYLQRKLSKNIEKNSYRVIQPFLVFLFLPLSYILAMIVKVKEIKPILFFVLVSGVFVLTMVLFRISGRMLEVEIVNVNIGYLLFIIILIPAMIGFAKIKYKETTRHKKWQAT